MEKTIVHRAHGNQVVPAEWGELTWYANAQLNNSDEMTVGKCMIKPDCKNPLHMHPNCSEVLVVMQGFIEHVIEEGKTVRMGPGDTITVPPNFYHNAKNVGHEEAILFIVFSSANRETKGE